MMKFESFQAIFQVERQRASLDMPVCIDNGEYEEEGGHAFDSVVFLYLMENSTCMARKLG